MRGRWRDGRRWCSCTVAPPCSSVPRGPPVCWWGATLAPMAQSFDLHQAPGHLVRRAHQRAVALFMEETAGFDVTPVQFAILNELINQPGADQVTLAARVALDAATSGSVIGRLEARGWIRRVPDARDRRRKLLWVTPAGAAVALQLRANAQRVQERLMAPLSQAEVGQLQALLTKLVCGPAVPGNVGAPHPPLSDLPLLSNP